MLPSPQSILAGHDLGIPLETIGTVIVAFFGLLITALLWSRRESRRSMTEPATPTGFCPSCSYDLTANLSGVCPECGTAVAKGVA